MFRKGSFNALVLGALPQAANDTIARLWYMRTLSVYNSLFLLLPETVAVLERGSEHEDPYALFALGRYHLCTQKDPDSTARAVNCFEKAWESGLIEAAVALAMSYDSGDIGMVDRLKAKTLLETALKEDCEYAAKYQIHKMIYGVKGSRQALPEAMRICTSLIDKQKKRPWRRQRQSYFALLSRNSQKNVRRMHARRRGDQDCGRSRTYNGMVGSCNRPLA